MHQIFHIFPPQIGKKIVKILSKFPVLCVARVPLCLLRLLHQSPRHTQHGHGTLLFHAGSPVWRYIHMLHEPLPHWTTAVFISNTQEINILLRSRSKKKQVCQSASDNKSRRKNLSKVILVKRIGVYSKRFICQCVCICIIFNSKAYMIRTWVKGSIMVTRVVAIFLCNTWVFCWSYCATGIELLYYVNVAGNGQNSSNKKKDVTGMYTVFHQMRKREVFKQR